MDHFVSPGFSNTTFPSRTVAMLCLVPLISFVSCSTDRDGAPGACETASSATFLNSFLVACDRSSRALTASRVTPAGASAISFTSRSLRTSRTRGARVCTRIVAGPSNWRKSWTQTISKPSFHCICVL